MSQEDKPFGYENSLLFLFKVNFWIRKKKILVSFSLTAPGRLWIERKRRDKYFT